ncbi:MAG TPA: dipeptide/oligopeptide/nickel ABC transporter ATP-binding protein [Verrucomicrobiae bacterium]|jgi:ABC-type glutathione transport system ATPase component|nr:dipeptide/oligopeptide/nickel ABC transporter ATP-binding protein [Verrucomicrobiae bacterium]
MAIESHLATAADAMSLRVRGLTRRYSASGSSWRKRVAVLAADDVIFEIPGGTTLALVGSSGSGKSTVARCVVRLEKPDAGEIWVGDTNIAQLGPGALAPFRTRIQMIFQDPATSMNSRMSAAEIIEEPLLIQRRGDRGQRRRRVAQLMEEVHLPSTALDRRALEFSGGQRQRIAIARALSLEPKLLVLDEAFTGLDFSTQKQVATLLLELQKAHALTYLLISHDLNLVARVAEWVAVMAGGKIVEQGPTPQIISRPVHKETRALLAAAQQLQSKRAAAQGASR